MKFFNWVQNKFNGAQQSNNKMPNALPVANQAKLNQEPGKEELISNWPNGILAIGTFGNRDQREDQEIQCAAHHEIIHQEDIDQESSPSPDHDLSDFTPEEVGHLQKELTKLLKRKPGHITTASTASKDQAAAADHLPLNRFLNCPSSLEVDRTISNRFSVTSDCYYYKDEEHIDRTIRAIIGRCKQVCMENKKSSSIGKKSISFLLKKMFVCRSGFAPAPSLPDTLLLQESRMEKLLRTMLSKKMYPQNGSRASSTRKFLVDRRIPKAEKDDETQDNKREGCKWVKTDSEYIVLNLD